MTTQAKFILTAAVIAAVVAGGAFLYFSNPVVAPGTETTGDLGVVTPSPSVSGSPAASPSPSSASVTKTPSPTAGGITMAQVAAHASASSCWSVVRGNVYDLTNWIGKHPGGEKAILQLCGKDGTALFTGQHGGQTQPESTLASFKIGVLAK